ncbi:hypothetical protein JQ608_06725 [Bradyrhizobium liaoningense]|uniref:hypothetical protein n=1 Tax=Bradyrhizobium liaoningense TaxID=43992 RepID=UPI001BA49296|nr:hypothetical protein [Bradyrhizobium liaoningense]MBR0876895.1 hypothetical protein [Bradyrhizobium liaoningense]
MQTKDEIHADALKVLAASRTLNALIPDEEVAVHLVRLALYEGTKARMAGRSKHAIRLYIADVLAEAARIHTEGELTELATTQIPGGV